MNEEEEEDSAKPIYKTSKAVMKKKKKTNAAAAVADKEKSQTKASSAERLTSTRKRSSAEDNQDGEASTGRPRNIRTVKRIRKSCSVDECTNIAVKGGVCTKHGAKGKRCKGEGCTNKAVKGGVCVKHGAERKLCSNESCTNVAVSGGVCFRHGAKHKKCSRERQPRGKDATETKIEKKGKSSVLKDQLKSSKRKREYLKEDQPGGEEVIKKKHRYEHSVYGFANYARKGGLCMSNAAKVDICRRKGCTNKVESGGACRDCKWHEVISYSSNNGYTSIIQNGQVDEKEDLSRVDTSENSSTALLQVTILQVMIQAVMMMMIPLNLMLINHKSMKAVKAESQMKWHQMLLMHPTNN